MKIQKNGCEIEKFIVSRDDSIYQAWPDVALTASGRLVCVFCECTHHMDRSYSRINYAISDDRGRTWAEKRALSTPLRTATKKDPHWNCPRITALSDGRLVVIVDRVGGLREGTDSEQSNWLWFSSDNGDSWSGPIAMPMRGVVPDRIIELGAAPHRGRWIASAHIPAFEPGGIWRQQVWFSDDKGQTWHGPHTAAAHPDLKLCEGSIVEMPKGELVCFLRENSGLGLDAFHSISRDGGLTWTDVEKFPLPGCHRPVGGLLQSGHALITYRFIQGGNNVTRGWVTQNFFAALTDVESCLAPDRASARARILPLDFDRSPVADLGYSGWVQFPDGEIYIVYYIVDDAPKGHIRGISMREDAFYIRA